MLIQTIPDLNKARLIYRCKQGKIYVASISQVWSISAVDYGQQIRTLLEQRHFQLALKLTVSSLLQTFNMSLFIHNLVTCSNFLTSCQEPV